MSPKEATRRTEEEEEEDDEEEEEEDKERKRRSADDDDDVEDARSARSIALFPLSCATASNIVKWLSLPPEEM